MEKITVIIETEVGKAEVSMNVIAKLPANSYILAGNNNFFFAVIIHGKIETFYILERKEVNNKPSYAYFREMTN